MLSAKYYKTAWANNLIFVGAEDGRPQFLGSNVDFFNFWSEIYS